MHGPDGKPSPLSRRVDSCLSWLVRMRGRAKTRGMAVAMVAAYLRVPPATVRGWAGGSVAVPGRLMGRLADALGVNLLWLTFGAREVLRAGRPAALGGRKVRA